MSTSEKIRWGILGPGGIAAKFVRDKERATHRYVRLLEQLGHHITLEDPTPIAA